MEYNLTYPKLTSTITDNGSNFVKAFKVFGIKIPNKNNTDDDEDDNDTSSDEECYELNLNSTDDLHLSLPKHIRCFAHTLSLCVTNDVTKTIQKSQELNTMHTQVMSKCSSLWNAASRPKSAEIINNILGHTLTRPGETRWNSLYDSLKQILNIKEKNYQLSKALGIKQMLTEQEYLYIEEHVAVTRPIAHALDILQGENNTFYGMVLPCLLSLQQKLRTLNQTKWTYCKRLIETLQTSIENRFASYFDFTSIEAKEASIAAFSHPYFKNKWLTCISRDKHEQLLSIFKTAILSELETEQPSTSTTSTESTELHCQLSSFFDFGNNTLTDKTILNNNNLELIILQYFAHPSNDYNSLNNYQSIKNIFLQYNTSLPSSAPVERLFSFATIINSPKANRLSDELFEQRVVLKANILNKDIL